MVRAYIGLRFHASGDSGVFVRMTRQSITIMWDNQQAAEPFEYHKSLYRGYSESGYRTEHGARILLPWEK